jgi:hypothetical protein
MPLPFYRSAVSHAQHSFDLTREQTVQFLHQSTSLGTLGILEASFVSTLGEANVVDASRSTYCPPLQLDGSRTEAL